MNILEALMGKKYPQFESAIYADGSKVVVTVSRTLSPDHVELDSLDGTHDLDIMDTDLETDYGADYLDAKSKVDELIAK